jgi:ABC-type branched-subunit amino acid transport system substrate-binding protein
MALAATALFYGAVSAQDSIVKIGHVAPTSGGMSVVGKDNENGARLAIDELNARGVLSVVRKRSSSCSLRTMPRPRIWRLR